MININIVAIEVYAGILAMSIVFVTVIYVVIYTTYNVMVAVIAMGFIAISPPIWLLPKHESISQQLLECW